jgi:hypothetical protein
MAHTFDIRFERSAGLAALLAPAENSFRWKGGGQLRIDRAGISFAVKRGLLCLFPLTRRVPAGHIRQVYREGEALHLTIGSADRDPAHVSCWAADAGTAAAIVELLPTRRTVEIEHATDQGGSERARYDRRALAVVFTALCAIGAAGALLWPTDREMSPAAMPLVVVPDITVEVNIAPRELVLPGDFVVTIPPGSPYFALASRHLDAFEKDAARLLADYRLDRTLLESGAMDAETFANRLGALELQWWNATYRILEDREFADLALLEFRATLLSAARHWRDFLSSQAEALRKGDHVAIAKSFDQLGRAEEVLARARLYLRQG